MGEDTRSNRAVGSEQRIGQRSPTSDLTIEWRPATRERLRLGGRATRREPSAHVIDLSVSGAKVSVVENDKLPIGAHVEIGLDGGRGTAAVRRVEHGPDHTSIYGIHFLHLDAQMREAVNRRASSYR